MNKNVTLYFKEGGSDKVYQAAIEPKDGLWVVNFAFGRGGATLSTGTKTQQPVDAAKAQVIFDKIVKEKMAKGYAEGEGATPYQSSDKEFTGIVPMLLTPIDDATAYVMDDAWLMQEKHDGRRVIVRKRGGKVEGINRKGVLCGIPTSVADGLSKLDGDFLIDGEMLGDLFEAFDLLEANGRDFRGEAYEARLQQLRSLLAAHDTGTHVAETWAEESKASAMRSLLERGCEGVVFKRRAATYRPGRTGDAVKHKFYETATFEVAAVNAKRSVTLCLLDGDQRVGVGNCTIPANHPVPPAGAIVEVRYLYAYKGGSVYQPVYLGVRDDVDAGECVLTQLKYRNGEDDAN